MITTYNRVFIDCGLIKIDGTKLRSTASEVMRESSIKVHLYEIWPVQCIQSATYIYDIAYRSLITMPSI